MTPSEAFAAIALAAVACDGEMDALETRALREQLQGRTPYRDLPEHAMGDLFDRLLDVLQGHGWEALIDGAIPLLSPTQRQCALAMAAHLMHANRVVKPIEWEMLGAMANRMAMAPERSAQILDVIALLNRDSLAE